MPHGVLSSGPNVSVSLMIQPFGQIDPSVVITFDVNRKILKERLGACEKVRIENVVMLSEITSAMSHT
jgi:hypothetical protein